MNSGAYLLVSSFHCEDQACSNGYISLEWAGHTVKVIEGDFYHRWRFIARSWRETTRLLWAARLVSWGHVVTVQVHLWSVPQN